MAAKGPDQAKAKNAAKLKKTVIESGNKSGKLATPKQVAKALDKPNKVEKLIQDVTNRYRVTAREARDIVTAVGTSITAPSYSKKDIMRPNKNLVTQVKDVAKAVTTGKAGSSSDIVKRDFLSESNSTYKSGKKRK